MTDRDTATIATGSQDVLWIIVVSWSEPEDGVQVQGPFVSRADAGIEAASQTFLEQFESYGELPDDVIITVQPLEPAETKPGVPTSTTPGLVQSRSADR